MTKPSFSLFARNQNATFAEAGHVIVPSPEHAVNNRKIFQALFLKGAGRPATNDEIYTLYIQRLLKRCAHPLFEQYPWLMPAAAMAQTRAFERKGKEGFAPIYLSYAEVGEQTLPVTYPEGQQMKIKVPHYLVLSHEVRGELKPAYWLDTKVELTKEGLYKFAGLEIVKPAPVVEDNKLVSLSLPEGIEKRGSTSPSAPQRHHHPYQLQLFSMMADNTRHLQPDGKRVRNRRPRKGRRINCTA